jgi:hypothetical protein
MTFVFRAITRDSYKTQTPAVRMEELADVWMDEWWKGQSEVRQDKLGKNTTTTIIIMIIIVIIIIIIIIIIEFIV